MLSCRAFLQLAVRALRSKARRERCQDPVHSVISWFSQSSAPMPDSWRCAAPALRKKLSSGQLCRVTSLDTYGNCALAAPRCPHSSERERVSRGMRSRRVKITAVGQVVGVSWLPIARSDASRARTTRSAFADLSPLSPSITPCLFLTRTTAQDRALLTGRITWLGLGDQRAGVWRRERDKAQ